MSGIIYGMEMERYLAFDALSSGVCHTLLSQSPMHAKWHKDHPSESNSAMDIGTVAHKILLEGNQDGIVIVDAEDWRTKAAKEARDAAREAGKVPILSAKLPVILNMVDAAKRFVASSEISGIFDRGKPEVTLTWEDVGTLCKARPDFLPDDHSLILHVKTTQGSAEPESWIRNQLFGNGYDVAAAFYERGLRALNREPIQSDSVFLVIEQEAPHGCSLIGLDPMTRDMAERKVQRAVGLWERCCQENEWPCYPKGICYSEMPAWEAARVERMELYQIQMREGIQA